MRPLRILWVIALLTSCATKPAGPPPTAPAPTGALALEAGLTPGERAVATRLAPAIAACERGDLPACTKLAQRLSYSTNRREDARLGAALAKGCAAKVSIACDAEAVTLAHGHGGKDGVARGLARLETSCGAGSGYACAHLSEIEMRGQLVPDKKDTGKKLATASCEKLGGYPCLPAISALPAGADPALRTALAQRACDGGDAMGCYELGLDVANPDGPATPDQARATALYEKACAQDFGQACFNLAWQFLRGTGAPKDEQRGRALLVTSCELGDPSGCDELARRDGDAQKYCDLWGAEACYTVAAELAQKRGETADTAEALVTAGTRAANRGSAAGLNVMSHLLKDNKRWCAANDNVKDSCTFAGLLYAAWMDDAPEGSDDRAESRKQAVEALAKACGAGAQPACAAKARVEAQRP